MTSGIITALRSMLTSRQEPQDQLEFQLARQRHNRSMKEFERRTSGDAFGAMVKRMRREDKKSKKESGA